VVPPAEITPSARETARDTARELVEAFFRGRNANTLRAYRHDLENFAAFLKLPTVNEAARRLLSSSAGDGNALVLRYRSAMVENRHTPATINRRLSALRALLKLGRMLGFVTWSIEIDRIRSDQYRDTRGPGAPAVAAMLNRVLTRRDAKGLRDAAIVRLLFDCALRRGELVALDREHYSAARGLYVRGKGRQERQWITLPLATKSTLEAWLEVRGAAPGPLFIALDENHRGHRLTGGAVYLIVQQLGADVGVKARPHGLRHSAITAVLDKTNGDVRSAQKYSRHRNLQTLTLYDDNRRDEGGRVAGLIALPGDDTKPVSPACARGHVYTQAELGLYCCRGECKDGERGDAARRIEWR
jgi:integrase/recombinase XerC